MTTPETRGRVVVRRVANGGNLINPSHVNAPHYAATHWKITKKGTLRLLDERGVEVARYKPMIWTAVWLEPVE